MLTTDSSKAPIVEPALNHLDVDFEAGETFLGIMANTDYSVNTDAEWVSVRPVKGGLAIKTDYSYLIDPRTASLTLTADNGAFTREVSITQRANNSAAYIQGDYFLAIGSAEANQSQSGQGIKNTYDGNTNTLYHSPYSMGSTSFPVTLTYTLKEASHVDYMVYTPRQDGNTNGNFREITVEVALASSPSTWTKVCDEDLGGSSAASRIDFGQTRMDERERIRENGLAFERNP